MEAVIQRWGKKPTYKLESLLSGINKNNIHKEISFGKSKGNDKYEQNG